MPFSVSFWALFTLIFLALIGQSLSIKCWACRSDADPKCTDPFDNSTFAITDCGQEHLSFLPNIKATMCRKTRQKVYGVWKYIRGCAYLGEVGIEGDERFCLMRTGTYNIFSEYCTCNSKDGCNTATGPKSPSLTYLLLPPFLTMVILYKILV